MRISGTWRLGLVLAVAVAGCGQAPAGDRVASAGGTPTAGASTAAAAGGGDKDRALRFSQCMRDQGLTWFPDPEPVGGGLRLELPKGTDKAKVDAAMAACKKYSPDGGERKPADPQQLERMRQMAQCMRDNGVLKFPDPDPDGGLRIDGGKLGMGPGDPTFDKAERACAKYGPGDGERQESTER